MKILARIERLETGITGRKIEASTWAPALRDVDRETYDRLAELVTAMTPEEINARKEDPKRGAKFQKMARLILIARAEGGSVADFRRRFMALVNQMSSDSPLLDSII